ncbi:hypothetical protein Vspart_02181 [Vibrio spartinae]|uniref:Uncharacterized protein n=1 Tax=Vibrio spartinae TaxID=1918945 RepID=A0ABX6R0V5_9VIBR|nr:hypothetical protein Vspart_02181 [Vibrio spartinae]
MIFHPEFSDRIDFLRMFHSIQTNHPTKKTIPGEWLGFSGQDARKRRFWTTRTSAKQKRFSGYSCISARVTGAQSTDASEIRKPDCASNLGTKDYLHNFNSSINKLRRNIQQLNSQPTHNQNSSCHHPVTLIHEH